MNHLAMRRRLLVAESEIQRVRLERDLCDLAASAAVLRSRGRIAASMVMGGLAWRGVRRLFSSPVDRYAAAKRGLMGSALVLARNAVGVWLAARTVRRSTRTRDAA